MKKIIKFFIAIVSCSLIPMIVLAQSFFGSSSNNSTSSQTIATPQPALSASDFKARVNSLSQSTKSNVTQELVQQLATKPLSSNSPPVTSEQPAQTIPAIPVMNTPSTQPAATTPRYAAPPVARSNAVAPPPTTNAPAISPQQGSSYTGFGAGDNNTAPANAPANNTNSWNVKY